MLKFHSLNKPHIIYLGNYYRSGEYYKDIHYLTGAESSAKMGKITGHAMKELTGKADGKEISVKVKEILGG